MNNLEILKSFDDLKSLSEDFLQTDSEKEAYAIYNSIDLDSLNLNEKQTLLKTLTPAKLRETKYFQQCLYKTFISLLEFYQALPNKEQIADLVYNKILSDTRNELGNSAHVPNRSKAPFSFLRNAEFSLTRRLDQNHSKYSKENINNILKSTYEEIISDLIAATLVFHDNNDISQYCKNSTDSKVKLLYKQLLTINNYLTQSDLSANSDSNLSFNDFYDISDVFIDGERNPKDAPKKIPLLNIHSIETYQDYYNQYIALLTLLTNCSMFEIINPKTHEESFRRIVSETDLSIYDIIELAKLSKPRNKDEFIDKINELTKKYYYIPEDKDKSNIRPAFDQKLSIAIEKQKELSKEDLHKKLSKKEKTQYTIELEHLLDNLRALKSDRLQNYILEKEIQNLILRIQDNITNLHISIKKDASKVVSKLNGFYAIYLILEINDFISSELQIHTEFRETMAKEGNAAHNTSHKTPFNMRIFFKLTNPSIKEETNKNSFNRYITFLERISLNELKGYPAFKRSRRDQENFEILKDLVQYSQSKLTIKNNFSDLYYSQSKHRKRVSLSKFINHCILPFYTARFRKAQTYHASEHNVVQSINQTDKDRLTHFLQNRKGTSVLADMIISAYSIKNPKSRTGSFFTISDNSELYTSIKRTGNTISQNQSDSSDFPLDFIPQGGFEASGR